ncbi:hypothetical protein ACIBJE_15900 [Micromonospora sp. NPDC050187]|uniref:hypothetical protein n=1 Tax=Micromonospora sp. NPDC050187 TaxID=3364277 RepID=UPI003790FD45
MSTERRQELRGKYLKLGTGELAAAISFIVVAIALVMPRLAGPDESLALLSALVPLLAILVQAGVYWLAARSWVGRAPMPATVAVVYRVFRTTNPVLLAVGLAGILVWWPERLGTALLVVAVWLFGAVEYLNYFLVRLAYPLGRWFTTVGQWRTPQLVQDLHSSAPTEALRSQPDQH